MDALTRIKNYRRSTPARGPEHISGPLHRVMQGIVDRAAEQGCLPEEPEMLEKLQSMGLLLGPKLE